jgi:hypothetical protein
MGRAISSAMRRIGPAFQAEDPPDVKAQRHLHPGAKAGL